MKPALLIISLMIASASFANDDIQVRRLLCEMLVNPEGIDVLHPKFSWEIVSGQRNVYQTAYHVIVASSKEKLSKQEADIWNSGVIHSGQSIQVRYSGKTLNSGSPYWWKIKTYTNKGESDWSEDAYWSMGLLKSGDWKAKWIGYDGPFAWDSITKFSKLSARYFRKEFRNEKQVRRASVYICGLGLYELFINGEKVGDKVLTPAPTDYRKSVLYNTYDVTSLIKTGGNAIGVVLGNGRFFTMRQDYKPKKINTFGYPKLLLQLVIEYDDGSSLVTSDDNWKMTADGPIRSNNEYDGEEYDARKEMNGWNKPGFYDSKWIRPQLVSAPAGILTAQVSESMMVMQHIQPVKIKEIAPHVFMADMGQNFAGHVSISVTAKSGDSIRLRFAESLDSNSNLYTPNLRDAKATDVYITKEGKQRWQPAFVYHGFRYVEVSNYPGTLTKDDITGNVIYDALETTGSFETSDIIINKIYKNAWWGIASNYKSMPVDCPQRNERQPWLGDRTIGSLGESFVFGNAKLYAKWLDDIQQSQTSEGAIPDVAPAFWNYYSDDVTWPAAYFTVADMLYKQFGDTTAITKHYASMKKFMRYMQQQYLKNDLLVKDKYGDWCVPPESKELIHAKDTSRITDGILIATAYYCHLLQLMQKFAAITNLTADVKKYQELSENLKSAFNQKFFNADQNYYGNNTVTSNLLPLCFNITPVNRKDKVFASIANVATRKNNSHISTGVIGTQWLMRTLTAYGRSDLAYTFASNTTYPSWGYMVENGATTIWELWNGNTANPQMNSQNHVMLIGDLIAWMFENVAGIKTSDTAVAFKQIVMQPSVSDKVSYAKASYHSMYGVIKSEWKKDGNAFKWNVSIPVNTTAIIYVPLAQGGNVLESNQDVQQTESLQFIKMENGKAIYKIGSGDYTFTSTI